MNEKDIISVKKQTRIMKIIAIVLAVFLTLSSFNYNGIRSVKADGNEPKKTITLSGKAIGKAYEEIVYDELGNDTGERKTRYDNVGEYELYEKNTFKTVNLGNASGQQSDVLYMDFGSSVEFEYNSEVPFETYFSTSDGQYKYGYESIYNFDKGVAYNNVIIVGSEEGGTTLYIDESGKEVYVGDDNIFYVIEKGKDNKSGTLKIHTKNNVKMAEKYNSYIHFYGQGGQLDYTLNISVMSKTDEYSLSESTLDVRQGRNATIDVRSPGTDGFNWFILKGDYYSTDILKNSGVGLVDDSQKVITKAEQDVANGTVSPKIVGGVTKADSVPGTFNAYSDRGIGDIYVLTETNSGIDSTDEKNKCVALLARKVQCITRLGISEWRKAVAIGFLKNGVETSEDNVEYNFLINSNIRLDNLVIGRTGKTDGFGNEIKTNDYFHFKLNGRTVNYKSENEKIAEYRFSNSGEYTLDVSTEDESVSKSCKIIISQPTSRIIAYKNEVKEDNVIGDSEVTGQSSTSATVRYNNEINMIFVEDSGANEPLKIRINNEDSSEYLSISEPEKLANNIFKYTVKVIKDVESETELNINVSTDRDSSDPDIPVNNINVAYKLKLYPSSENDLNVQYKPEMSGYESVDASTSDNVVLDIYEGETVSVITTPEGTENGATDQIIYNVEKNAAFIEKNDSSSDLRSTVLSWKQKSGDNYSVLRANALSSQEYKKDASGKLELDAKGMPIPVYRDKDYDGNEIPENEREKVEYLKYNNYKDIKINTKVKTELVTLALVGNESANPTINVGNEYELKASVTPVNSDETLYWKSVNSNIKFVVDDEETSEIIGGPRTVKIIAKSRTDLSPDTANGAVIQVYSMHMHGNKVHKSSRVNAVISIKVKEAGNVEITPEDWTIAYENLNQGLTAKVYGVSSGVKIEIEDPTVNWDVENDSVVSINSNQGTYVTATSHKVGETRIFANSGTASGYSSVTVTAPLSDENIVVSDLNTDISENVSADSYIYLPNGMEQTLNPVFTATNGIDSRADADGNCVLKKQTDEEFGDYIITDSFSKGNDIGNYYLTLTPGTSGLYTGSSVYYYRIHPKKLGDGTYDFAEGITITQKKELIYNATNQKPELEIVYKKGNEEQVLVYNKDYYFSNESTVNAGEYEITISGYGNFAGSVKYKFEIKPFDLKTQFENGRVKYYNSAFELVTENPIADQTYTTNELKPVPNIFVKYDGYDYFTQISMTTNVELEYSDNIDVGVAKIKITGKGDFSGELNTTFNVVAKDISIDYGLTVENILPEEFTGFQIRPDVDITYNSKKLVKDIDYELTYENNIDSTTVSGKYAVVNVTGIGNYSGSRKREFIIDQADLSTKVTIDPIPDLYQLGNNFLKPEITARLGDYKLVEGVDYTTFYGKYNGEAGETYNINYGSDAGVVAITYIANSNFTASQATSVSGKWGQEAFFNIKAKDVQYPADDISIKRIVTDPNESTELIKDAIYVNATGGVKENTTVEFEIEAIRNDGSECDDPVFAEVSSNDRNKFSYSVEPVDLQKGNKAILKITGGSSQNQGVITLVSEGAQYPITVIINDPATNVDVVYDSKTDMDYVYSGGIENKRTSVYENHDFYFNANLSRGTTDTVEWSSTKEDVAIVDENGHVTTLKKGSTRIYATTKKSELYPGGVAGYVDLQVMANSMAKEVKITDDNGSMMESLNLERGKTFSLTGKATAISGKVTEKLTWASTDENVVKISSGQGTSKAVIEAVGPGKATISYGSEAENGVRASCEVTVFVAVESLELSENSLLVMTDDTCQLTATLNELAIDEFVWSSDKPDAVSIDVPQNAEKSNSQTVTLHGLELGETATITVYAKSNKNSTTRTCKVSVVERPADNVEIDKTELHVYAGEEFTLKGTSSSIVGTVSETLLWGIKNDKVEFVSGEYSTEPTFRAKQTSGKEIITYGSAKQNGKKAECVVYIEKRDLMLSSSKLTVAPNGTAKLKASYFGDTIGSFEWSSSDESIVKISGSSEEESNSQTVDITGLTPGKTAVITVRSRDDSNIFATCTVIVSDCMADNVTISATNLTLDKGKTVELTGIATSIIGDVTEPIVWTTSNSSVVSLSGNVNASSIVIKASAAGTAIITYGSKVQGGKTAKCIVTVKNPQTNPGGDNGGNNGGNNNNNNNVIAPGNKTEIGGAVYVVNKDNTVTYVSSPKVKGTVKIPATVKIGNTTVKVTSVKAGAFKNNTKISSVVIGKNVTNIEKDAFSGCAKLKKVTIGANVTKIGNNAFKGCKLLTSITIPSKVTTIGANAFAGCSKLNKVIFKSSKISKIGKGAFKTIKNGATFKCPKAKLKAYTSKLNKSGVPKKAKITK